MSVQALVLPHGDLNPAALSSVPEDSEELVSVVATFGAHSGHQQELLDDIFQTSFASSERAGITTATVLGDDSAVIAEAPHHTLLLSTESFDGPDRSREEAREKTCHLSIAICDAILFVVRMSDLARVNTNGLSALRASITQLLLLQSDRIVPSPADKRAFMVVVREHEPDVVTREEIISGFQNQMHEVYANVARPPGSPTRVTDLFEFEFFLLPSEHLEKTSYEDALHALRTRLLDPASDDYFFEGSRFSRRADVALGEIAEGAWKKLNEEETGDMPATKDLMSAFDCDNAMRNVFEKYQRSVRVWRRETDGGVIIEKFGEAASDMVQKTIDVYDQDASPHKGSKAFKRKKEELRDLLDADLYSLFVVQIAKLREVTYRSFKDKLSNIDDSEANLEKVVNDALKASQNAFKKNAEALRPRVSPWRYDNDTKELAAQMREDATERLQRARLADYQESGGRRSRRRRALGGAGTKKRQPINVSFHYLDPAPFGWKDSRYEKLSVDDNLEFQGDSSKALVSQGSGGYDGLSVPLAPTDSNWFKRNQDFIYTDRK